MPYTPEENRRRMKRYRLERARGVHHRVPTDLIRSHIDRLHAAGMSNRAIVLAAGYSPETSLNTFLRRPSISRTTAQRLLAVEPGTPPVPGPNYRISAVGSRRRLQALAAIGWTLPALAARTTETFPQLRAIREARHPTVRSGTAIEISRLYDALAMTPGPSALARTIAKQNNWAPPLAWDDDDLDTRDAQPHLATSTPITRDEMLLEFEHTRDQHGGRITLAATRLGADPLNLARRIQRAKAAGHDIDYVDDTKPLRRQRVA
ncbi:MAG: hypothetical protein GC157_18500 [Frankiales bacterium]|nr:hypothetical protein [Frankiales bacterium]